MESDLECQISYCAHRFLSLALFAFNVYSKIFMTETLSYPCAAPFPAPSFAHWMDCERFWFPIACREREIATINDFIEQFFAKQKSMLLVITGRRSTGKTLSIWHCYRMSAHQKQIRFVDCDHRQMVPNISDSPNSERMIILDNVECGSEIDKIINYYRDLNVGIICVSRKQMNFNFLPNNYSISVINYGMYSEEQLVVILKESLACSQFRDDVSLYDKVLIEIANHACAKNLTALDAQKLLFDHLNHNLFENNKNKTNVYK